MYWLNLTILSCNTVYKDSLSKNNNVWSASIKGHILIVYMCQKIFVTYNKTSMYHCPSIIIPLIQLIKWQDCYDMGNIDSQRLIIFYYHIQVVYIFLDRRCIPFLLVVSYYLYIRIEYIQDVTYNTHAS